MNFADLEKLVLKKLEKGLLDGVVGKDYHTGGYATVTFRKIIKNGIPQIIRFGADSKYFDNKETVKVAGKQTIQLIEDVTEKLKFLQKYGWLIDDPDTKAYSSFFKPKP